MENVSKESLVYLLDDTFDPLVRINILNKILEYYDETCVYPEIFIAEIVNSNYRYRDKILEKYTDLLLKGYYSKKEEYCNLQIRLELILYIKDQNIKKQCIKKTIEEFIDKDYSTGLEDFLKYISDKNIIKEEFENLLQILKRTLNPKSYFKIIKVINDIEPSYCESLNNFIEKDYDSIVRRIAAESLNLSGLNKQTKFSDIQFQNVVTLIKLFLSELMEHEHANYLDIDYISKGASSIVIGIKNRVIKVGIERFKYEVPNSEYILQPILRKQFKELNNYTIEVTNRVEQDLDISYDELYNLYINLRNQGIIWTDINPKNVGRLIKDNISDYELRTGNLENNSEVSGMKSITKVLKAGELVVIDTDLVYSEKEQDKIGDFNIKDSSYDFYENRYQIEQLKK